MLDQEERVYDDETKANGNTGQHDNLNITEAERVEFDRIASSLQLPTRNSSQGQPNSTTTNSQNSSGSGMSNIARGALGSRSSSSSSSVLGGGASVAAAATPGGIVGRAKSFLSRKKKDKGSQSTSGGGSSIKKGAAFAAMAVGALVAILMVLMNLLEIPAIVGGIVGQRFAAVTRETVNANSKTMAQTVALQSAPESTYQELKARYNGLKNQTFEKVNSFKPNKVLENLLSEGKMQLNYSEPSGIGGRQRLTSIVVNGKTFPMGAGADASRVLNPIDYLKGKYNDRVQFKMALHDALRGRNLYIRYKTAKAARARIKVKMWAWSRDDLKKFKNAGVEKIQLENARISHERATNKGESTAKAKPGSSSEKITETAEETAKGIEECVASDACLKQTITQARNGNGSVPGPVYEALGKAFSSDVLEKVMSGLNPVYMIGVPLCLIYDGSIVNSAGTIDANSEQAQRTFYWLASGGSQQQAGGNNVNSEALSGMARQMGDNVGNSNSQRIANGISVDTTSNTTPTQASASGTYSADIFDTFLPSTVASTFAAIAQPSCAVLTSPWTFVGVIAVTILPGVGEAMQAGGQLTARAIGGVIAKQLFQVLRGFFTKKELAKFGAITGMTVAATYMAQALVLQHTGAGSNGLQQGEDFPNIADMGGDQVASENERVEHYGAPLTNAEANKLKPINLAFLDDEKHLQTPYQRYLAVTNPGSLANQIVLRIGYALKPQGLQNMASNAASLLNPVKLLSMATAPLNKYASVKAQSASNVNNSNYNNVQWYWTEEEERNFMDNPAYTLFTNQEALDQSGKEEEINSKFARCYTDSMGTLLSGGGTGEPAIYRNEDGDVIPDKGLCSPNNLGMKNPDYGDLVYRWRVAKRHMTSLDNLIDVETLSKK